MIDVTNYIINFILSESIVFAYKGWDYLMILLLNEITIAYLIMQIL